ncbi:MAG: methylated-DNA--[Lachnospiraceae bacterium]|nr:methylated-DNA--[protein]-cysteine S-methyltransferase [Lachnospiraceae bacterium]
MTKYAFYKSSWGLLKIGYEENKIVYLKCTSKQDAPDEPSEISEQAFWQLSEYFAGKRKNFDLPIELKGTAFQKEVWNALLEIPYGETRSYKDIAASVGRPKACRAVGMANHNNPLWIIVPCHRVVGTNQKLTGYAGGLDMKKSLLEMEKNVEI